MFVASQFHNTYNKWTKAFYSQICMIQDALGYIKPVCGRELFFFVKIERVKNVQNSGIAHCSHWSDAWGRRQLLAFSYVYMTGDTK